MFNKEKLSEVLTVYKKNFISMEWPKEKYKWIAVKCFQDHWDVNAEDFPAMLHQSLSMTYNLLASQNNYPGRLIEEFAQAAPDEVRAMFVNLYDERLDILERITAFKDKSEELLKKYKHDAAQHYQKENAITTYLWLRYPDKYYIFKYGEYKNVATVLESDYSFKKGAYADNIRNGFNFYNEICDALKQDAELLSIFKSELNEECYPDPACKTLTADLGFYISRYYMKNAVFAQGW